jgi:hypothetical protein
VQPGSEPGRAGGEETGGYGRRTDPDASQGAGLARLKLDPQEQALLQELKSTDRQVRAHEQAHVSAGGPYVSGGASFTYQTGPDGQKYAVGGEVPVDASPEPGDPEATIQKARTIGAAALAPADPSPQDRQVAAQAAQMEAQARMEKVQQEQGQAAGSAGASHAEGEGVDLDLARAKEPPPPIWARLRSWSVRI